MSEETAVTQEATTTEVQASPIDRAIAAMQAKLAPGEPPGEAAQADAAEPAQEGQEAQRVPEATPQSPPPASESKPQEEVPLTARQLAVLARREKELAQRLSQLEQEATTKAEQLAEQKVNEFVSRLQADPSLLSKHGVDLSLFAGEAWNHSLGENAPPEFREALQRKRFEHEISTLKQEIASLKEGTSAKQAPLDPKVIALAGDITGLAAAIPADMPLLQAEYQEKPQETLQGLAKLGDYFLAQGEYKTARQLAQILEETMAQEVESRAQRLGYQKIASKAPEQRASETKSLSDAELKQKPDRNNAPLTEAERLERGKAVLRKLGLT